MADWFAHVAQRTASLAGHPLSFVTVVFLLVVWAASGPLFGFDTTWQLLVNTGTTIVTFLMVFLIQNTQNRDSEALHIKLDELLHSIRGAREELLDAEEESTRQLQERRDEFRKLAVKARDGIRVKESESREPGDDQPER